MSYMLLVLYYTDSIVFFTVVNIVYDDLDDFIQLTRYYYDGSIQYWQLAYITYWYKYHITYINKYHQLYIWYSTTPYNIADDDYDSSIQSR